MSLWSEVSVEMGSCADLKSKIGNIHLANEMAQRLRGDGVISVSLRELFTYLQILVIW